MALTHLIDLASERVGGSVMAANDEFFASRENLVSAADPVEKDEYVLTGKWMDGWETRRRREAGHDWCIVRLGLRGRVRSLVIDTAFFRGNYPEQCSVEACDASGHPGLAELEGAAWREIVPRSPLQGDHKNVFAVRGDRPATHLRLRIYPDGGVARLRALGEVAPDWDERDFTGELVDLAAVESGGRVLECSDMFFGDAHNMLMPGRARDMSDGWETRRRRGEGHDWAVVELGAAGRLSRIEIDTSHFKGNAPGQVAIEGCLGEGLGADVLRGDGPWRPLLPRARLLPHTLHRFAGEIDRRERVRHLRVHVYPDGGIARLRVWGRTDRSERLILALGRAGAIGPDRLREELARCCGSPRWAAAVAEDAPWVDVASLLDRSDAVWRSLGREDWLAAFAAHPRIGERSGTAWSQGEQAGTEGARDDVMQALFDGNLAYEERFGHIYIVCATGRSGDDMLADLMRRMHNDPDVELVVASEEQRKITRLRLVKWLFEQPAR
jgi:allantoicase